MLDASSSFLFPVKEGPLNGLPLSCGVISLFRCVSPFPLFLHYALLAFGAKRNSFSSKCKSAAFCCPATQDLFLRGPSFFPGRFENPLILPSPLVPYSISPVAFLASLKEQCRGRPGLFSSPSRAHAASCEGPLHFPTRTRKFFFASSYPVSRGSFFLHQKLWRSFFFFGEKCSLVPLPPVDPSHLFSLVNLEPCESVLETFLSFR